VFCSKLTKYKKDNTLSDLKNFILDNNIINVKNRSKNGNKTGANTTFYIQNKKYFDRLLEKHKTDCIVEASLLELEVIKKGRCPICNSFTKYSNRKKDYLLCCSKKCQSIQSDSNRKQTNIERYGTEFPMRNDDIKKKQITTNLDKYGVENVFQIADVKIQIEETNLRKYGVKYSGQKVDFLDKMKNTNMEKYGVEFPAQNKNIRLKIDNTLTEKYGSNTHQPISNSKDLNTEFIVENLVRDGLLSISDVLDYFSCSRNYWLTKIKPLVPNNIHIKKARGLEQSKIANYISGIYHGTIIQDDRKAIDGLELDIFLPELNFAIEYNGTYWHSEGIGEESDKHRHIEKTERCEKKGITLFHIWEYEWLDPIKQEILKSMISNKLRLSKRIYARKCVIREISSDLARTFCNENHIQGYVNSSIRYGLFYEDELVFVATFGKPRYNSNYEWELLRVCSKKYHTIVGAFQKSLRNFIKMHKGPIISYANRNYSSGDVYRKGNFIELPAAPPSYKYWKCNTDRIVSRFEAQKHKLENLLEIYNKELTEKENMLMNGYRIFWDCGNRVFSYTNK
jgi:hypothetical protein